MHIKRTEIDWRFDVLDDEQFEKEMDRLAEIAKDKVERLIDLFYEDNTSVKATVEISRAQWRIDHFRKYTQRIDIFKQQIQRLLMHYEK